MRLPKMSMHNSIHKRGIATFSSEMTIQISRASTLPASSEIEPVVRASSPLPPGYKFLPKGNVYMTRNCRQRTHLAYQTVYVVVNDEKKQVGIRVPSSIYEAVKQSETNSRQSRQQMVKKRDKALEESFRKAILDQFPSIPPKEVPIIIRHATKKGKGRVGRTGTRGMAEKARLATQAHIRHTKTDYDCLLESGIDREAARDSIFPRVLDILQQWGLSPTERKKYQAKKGQITTKSAQATSKVPHPLVKTAKHRTPGPETRGCCKIS